MCVCHCKALWSDSFGGISKRVCVKWLVSLSLLCHCIALSAHFSPLALRWSYCIAMKTSSLPSSCRVRAAAWRLLPPPLLLRSVRAGREALAGGGPREEDEWEEDEGKGATVALTLLLAPSWRPWFCGWKRQHTTFLLQIEGIDMLGEHTFNAT